LKFPVSVSVPLSVELENVQGELSKVRLKLVVPKDPSAFTVKCVINANVLTDHELDSAADHVPLILAFVVLEFDPQPETMRVTPNNATTAALFMVMAPLQFADPKRHLKRMRPCLRRMPGCGWLSSL
jgi:hypothetical protein